MDPQSATGWRIPAGPFFSIAKRILARRLEVYPQVGNPKTDHDVETAFCQSALVRIRSIANRDFQTLCECPLNYLFSVGTVHVQVAHWMPDVVDGPNTNTCAT